MKPKEFQRWLKNEGVCSNHIRAGPVISRCAVAIGFRNYRCTALAESWAPKLIAKIKKDLGL